LADHEAADNFYYYYEPKNGRIVLALGRYFRTAIVGSTMLVSYNFSTALAEEKTLVCKLPAAKMYLVLRMDIEEISRGIIGTARVTLDDIGSPPGTLAAMKPLTPHAVDGDRNNYILTNLRTGNRIIIDRNTGIGSSGNSTIYCQKSQKNL
jgi:hypothetical protein